MRRAIFSRVVATIAFTAPLALAWTSSAPLNVKVHHHEFNHVEVTDNGCVLTAVLKFTAPERAYSEPAQVRNYYRFKARVRFASGKLATSGTFFSKATGQHKYSFRFDTQDQGCWAEEAQQAIRVDVEGCRGQGCSVQPFKD